ncbi:CRISPR-associated helicase Cas3' [Saxibacter everestensis]|uniref:CRISPR-associated helicase Cas3 n=1 Tax=Saxibacter everestensis TaxID=2909229 RepID=A0ABY8QR17_9MICO|nr:CRISPR-associated helicase Cas3' [Brevibacteriaceae bacterium ZFBP1038]
MSPTGPSQTELSPAARIAWAKSKTDDETHREIIGWLPLVTHLDDAAAVAARLWDHWVPAAIRRQLATASGGDDAHARRVFIWLAGIHDVAKASPAFAVQVEQLAAPMEKAGLRFERGLAKDPNRPKARHERVGFLAVRDWLADRHGFTACEARPLASIVAAHHGLPPDTRAITWLTERPELVGTGLWAQVRMELLDRAERMHLHAGDLERCRTAALPPTVQVLLSALVIMADWIASSEDLFPYASPGEVPSYDTGQRVEAAWRQLKLPVPWTATDGFRSVDELFTARFDFPTGARPRPAQRELVEAAEALDEPALLILEAEMGMGKTEAALAAAEVLAAKFGLGGVFIALPSQATSDALFARTTKWIERLGIGEPNSVFLAHSKARLNNDYSAMLSRSYFRSIGQDEPEQKPRRPGLSEAAAVHLWMTSAKRGPLANFVVGTIDQVLFGSLRSRHLMLRHLALASKVVVIDECHAYDTYMNSYLDRALHWLGAYGVPVVMLSATLPSSRRKNLVEAYDSGVETRRAKASESPPQRVSLAERRQRSAERKKEQPTTYDALDGDIGYPSIVVSGGPTATTQVLTPAPTGSSRRIAIERIENSDDALIAALSGYLTDGGCVAVIRNTVDRAQRTAEALRASFPDTDVTLSHSRFLAADRAATDRRLLNLFGPPSRASRRPARHIVVATQVIEQSLDLDFDLMISDLAPIDLLLQRAGRLHRHQRTDAERPEPLRTPKLLISGVDWTAVPPKPDSSFCPASRKRDRPVYQPHVLYRTLAVLQGRESLDLPDDITKLVQLVYGRDQLGPEEWHSAMAAALVLYEDRQRESSAAAATHRLGSVGATTSLIDWVYGTTDDPTDEVKGRAAVRDTEETLEVLVLTKDRDGTIGTPSWLDHGGGESIQMNETPPPKLAKVILGCSINLPVRMCRYGRIDRHIAELKDRFDLQYWHSSRDLNGELPLILDAEGRAELNGYQLHYDPHNGLVVTRDE